MSSCVRFGRLNSLSLPVQVARQAAQCGAVTSLGATAVIFVSPSARLCGRSAPVRRSIVPDGVLSSQGSTSKSYVTRAWARSARASDTIALMVAALLIRAASLGGAMLAPISRTSLRERSYTARVRSIDHRCASHRSHVPHSWT